MLDNKEKDALLLNSCSIPEAAVVMFCVCMIRNIKCCSGVSGMIATFRRIWGPTLSFTVIYTIKSVNPPVVYRCSALLSAESCEGAIADPLLF
ncbi:hypothetical protein QQF64_002289 [Cirrhinus molitorella]|uniref:Uncharacterized protein n=1 Tax=Cirrhinus molitorella TaxID=172907 RepID=A0ABR3MPR4_9TELE